MGKYQTMVDVGKPDRILLVSVVTPEATLLETPAQFVALPLYDGELEVLPGHSAFIGRLGYGELRVVEGSTIRRYFIAGGFAQVIKNVVSILTSSAVAAEKLDIAAAEEIGYGT